MAMLGAPRGAVNGPHGWGLGAYGVWQPLHGPPERPFHLVTACVTREILTRNSLSRSALVTRFLERPVRSDVFNETFERFDCHVTL